MVVGGAATAAKGAAEAGKVVVKAGAEAAKGAAVVARGAGGVVRGATKGAGGSAKSAWKAANSAVRLSARTAAREGGGAGKDILSLAREKGLSRLNPQQIAEYKKAALNKIANSGADRNAGRMSGLAVMEARAKGQLVDGDRRRNITASPIDRKWDKQRLEADLAEKKGVREAATAEKDATKKNERRIERESDAAKAMTTGAAAGAGFGLGASAVGVVHDVAYVGFWMLLTLALSVIDYFWLHFGGLDYKVFLQLIRPGGIELLIRIMLPIYVLAVLIILLALGSAKSRKAGIFIVVVLIPLTIANYLETTMGVRQIPYISLSLTVTTLLASMVIVSNLIEDREKFYSWAVLLVTGSTIFSLGGLESGPHHLLVAALIWAFVLRESSEDWTKPNFMISVLLIIDFFGFGVLRYFAPTSLIANRFVFPLWFLFLVFYTGQQGKSRAAKFLMVAVIIFYIIALTEGMYGWANIRAQINVDSAEVAQAKGFFDNVIAKIKAIPANIQKQFESSVEYATGGYYNSKVEENQDPSSKLGVYLEDVKPSNSQFDKNDDVVVVWGNLRAKTIDEAINITMGCWSGEEKGTIKPDVLAKAEGYKIDQFEDIGFECRFEPGKLKEGTNAIEVKVNFNFETLAYLRTHFMDMQTMRDLKKNNIDPLIHYGIPDRKGVGVSTYGPVKLGMGTNDPPIGLLRDGDSYPYLGVTVENAWTNGQIKNVTDVRIQIPDKLELETDDGTYCRGEFELVEDSEAGAEGYKTYKVTEVRMKKVKVPITTYQSWRCLVNVKQGSVGDVLGSAPIATYFYRASVDYIYEIQTTVPVFVRSLK